LTVAIADVREEGILAMEAVERRTRPGHRGQEDATGGVKWNRGGGGKKTEKKRRRASASGGRRRRQEDGRLDGFQTGRISGVSERR
jgi:hypothetical protein